MGLKMLELGLIYKGWLRVGGEEVEEMVGEGNEDRVSEWNWNGKFG